MELFLGVLLGLFVLVVLVVLHELGHAIVARRNGVVVEEFGIGFPPRAWKKKLKNGVLFTLNWLPLGGFVKLKGEHDSATDKGTYGAASFWVKTKILFAGVIVNWLTAAVLFTLLAFVGLPQIVPNQVVLPFDSHVTYSPLKISVIGDGSPAQKAGLQIGDTITQINDVKLTTVEDMRQVTAENAGKKVNIKFIRDDQAMSAKASLRTESEASNGSYLGVGSAQSSAIRATWSAPILGIATASQLTGKTLVGVGDMLVKSVGGLFGQLSGNEATRQAARAGLAEVGEGVAGPVGILAVIFPSVVNAGLTQILLLAAIISLALAVMNILPIPALDGGRWVTMAIFRVLNKKLTKEREENIQVVGFMILMALMILVTWSDVGKIL